MAEQGSVRVDVGRIAAGGKGTEPRERVVVLLFVLALVGLFAGHLLHLVLSLAPAH